MEDSKDAVGDNSSSPPPSVEILPSRSICDCWGDEFDCFRDFDDLEKKFLDGRLCDPSSSFDALEDFVKEDFRRGESGGVFIAAGWFFVLPTSSRFLSNSIGSLPSYNPKFGLQRSRFYKSDKAFISFWQEKGCPPLYLTSFSE